MTDIDVSKIKPGDIIGLVVDDVDERGVWVENGADLVRLKPSAIVSHTPAPKPALKVGDRVREVFGTQQRDREIIWTDGFFVYLSPPTGGATLAGYLLSEVETWERLS